MYPTVGLMNLINLCCCPPPPPPVALQSLKDLGGLTYRRFLELFRHMVGLLGRVISPSQGIYLYGTTQHRKTRTNIHTLSGIRTHDPSNQPAKTHASNLTATVTWDRMSFFLIIKDMPIPTWHTVQVRSIRVWYSEMPHGDVDNAERYSQIPGYRHGSNIPQDCNRNKDRTARSVTNVTNKLSALQYLTIPYRFQWPFVAQRRVHHIR
jgi:hypothetical protein